MTIKDIAKLAGVSISTVSKIVNHKDDSINPQTRSRVLQIVKEYNYTPYGMVKNSPAARKFLLGVLLRTASRAGRLINGIMQTAQEQGYSILLLDSGNSPETEAKHITVLCSNGVDGVIWEPVGEDSHLLGQALEKQNIPFCLINGHGTLPSCRIDYAQMGYGLTQKLIEFKHTNIACLLKEGSRRSQALYEGFQRCLYDHQIPCMDKTKIYVTDENYCQDIINRHITGIVSSHFASSVLLFEQMEKLHYHIPCDFSLISLKDEVSEAVSYPRISGMKIPYYEFGQYVAQKIIGMCEKTEENQPSGFFVPAAGTDNEDSLDIPVSRRYKRIVVVGSINMDVIFNVDELPQQGKTTNILNSTRTVGGKGANQSVGVAKLGHEAALIGEIGGDTDSLVLFDVLEKEHVLTQGVHRDKHRQTGKAYIYMERDGESAISILPGANSSLMPEAIEKRQYLFEHAGYCLISTEIPIEAAVRAAEIARSCGAKTVVKPATLNRLPEELLKKTDIFIPNKKEASLLCPAYGAVEEQAEFFLGQGAGTVIITLGHEGCYLKTMNAAGFFPASDMTAVDTTGGADAFIAALSVYLNEGYPLEKAIPIAMAAAGFCVSRQGTVPALADRNTLEMYIAKAAPGLLIST